MQFRSDRLAGCPQVRKKPEAFNVSSLQHNSMVFVPTRLAFEETYQVCEVIVIASSKHDQLSLIPIVVHDIPTLADLCQPSNRLFPLLRNTWLSLRLYYFLFSYLFLIVLFLYCWHLYRKRKPVRFFYQDMHP